MSFKVEHTDTYGCEANYCWVNRYKLTIPDRIATDRVKSDGWLIRQAKALTGLTGVRCRVSNMGDLIEIRPYGLNQIVFISWEDDEEND